MTTPTPESRALAIAAALAFTAGGLTILLGPALLTPLEWTAYHWLTILTVFGTIAAGHLLSDAGRAGRWLACLGFLVLFLSGTALVVYNSVGRQTEASGGKALETAGLNDKITAKTNALNDARRRLIKANDKVELYTNGGRDAETGQKIKPGCGRICEDWKLNRSDLVTVVKTLERELDGLGPKKPVNAKAETFAEIAALFSFDKAKAAAAFTLIEPFLSTLFFEIGSIVSLGFAFRRTTAGPTPAGRAAASAELPAEQKNLCERLLEPERTDEPASAVAQRAQIEHSDNVLTFRAPGQPNVPPHPNGSGQKVGRRARRTDRKAAVLSDIAARIEAGERFESQEALRKVLCKRFGPLAKSSLSNWLDEHHAIRRERDGRRKAVG